MSSIIDFNIRALTRSNAELAAKIENTRAASEVQIVNARDGSQSATISKDGRMVSLHSAYNPVKEGVRLKNESTGSGSYLFLGLACGHNVRPFLCESTELLFIAEFSIAHLRAFLNQVDLTDILMDPRVILIADRNYKNISSQILEIYIPYLHGSLSVIAPKAMAAIYPNAEEICAKAAASVATSAGTDVTTQKTFGSRWMRNIASNARDSVSPSTVFNRNSDSAAGQPIHITSAGPSLENTVKLLQHTQEIIIATDTSLPFLTKSGIVPNYVISIDCQNHSYHHFMAGLTDSSTLVVDLSSPPSLCRLSSNLFFFAGGHPFARYLAAYWFPFLQIDTSGGNVTHAAVSFANALGASEIILHGADFSFPKGKLYARGTYLYPYFRSMETRTNTLDSSFSRLLFEGSLSVDLTGNTVVYRSPLMSSYKSKLIAFANTLSTPLFFRSEMENRNKTPILCEKNELRKPSATAQLSPWNNFAKKTITDLDHLKNLQGSVRKITQKLTRDKCHLLYSCIPMGAAVLSEESIPPGNQVLNIAVEKTMHILREYSYNA